MLPGCSVERLLREKTEEVPMRAVDRSAGAGLARKALLARKQKLATGVAILRRSQGELEPAGPADLLDRAVETRSNEVLATLQAAEARQLAEIDAALKRVARGLYGWCERCGGQIGQLRLRAVPEARLCMGCAGQR
jgi:RNA polymerase-binding transcription factor DksA